MSAPVLRFCSVAVNGRCLVGIETPEGLLDGTRVLREVLRADVEHLSDALAGGLLDDAPVGAILDALAKPRKSWRLSGPVLVLPPVERGATIIGVGRNYPAHAAERAKPMPETPVLFQKPGGGLVATEAEIVIAAHLDGRVDHEAELAVVIGTRAHRVAPERAYEHVAGYTVVNDVTARAQQDADAGKGLPWFRGKGQDTFCPMGPGIVPRRLVPDPHALRLTCRVNGVVRQDASTGDMHFKIPAILAAVSRVLTLHPGDVISTGTPAGVGPLVAGDVVECEVSGIGALRNRVVRR